MNNIYPTNSVNLSTTINHIKRLCGLTYIPNPLMDKQIEEVIIQESLITFSTYYPFIYKTLVVPERDRVPHERNQYFLRLDRTDISIIGIKEHYTGNFQDIDVEVGRNYNGYYNNRNPYDLLMLQAYTNVASMSKMPEGFLFHAPNIIELKANNYFNNQPTILVVLKCTHPVSLETIPISLIEQWYAITTLDVKISLYNILKYYDNAETPFGTIDIKTDQWSNSEDERKNLLELWDTRFLKEPNRKKIYFS